MMPRALRFAAAIGGLLLSTTAVDAQFRPLQNLRGGTDAGLGYEVAPNSGGQILRLRERFQNLGGGYDPNSGQPLLQNGRGRPIVDVIGSYAVRAEDSSLLQRILGRGETPLFREGRLIGSEGGVGSGEGPAQQLMARLRERLGSRGESGAGRRLLDNIQEALSSGDGSRITAALGMASSILTGVSTGLASGGYGGGGQDLTGALREAERRYNLRKD